MFNENKKFISRYMDIDNFCSGQSNKQIHYDSYNRIENLLNINSSL